MMVQMVCHGLRLEAQLRLLALWMRKLTILLVEHSQLGRGSRETCKQNITTPLVLRLERILLFFLLEHSILIGVAQRIMFIPIKQGYTT